MEWYPRKRMEGRRAVGEEKGRLRGTESDIFPLAR